MHMEMGRNPCVAVDGGSGTPNDPFIPRSPDGLGSRNEAPATDGFSPWSLIALLKGGLLPAMLTKRLVSAAATTNSTLVKNAPGRIYQISGYNAAATVRYFKLYNTQNAPTVGTDIPVRTIALPPTAGFVIDWPRGYPCPFGIGFGLSTGSADTDTTALTAADVVGINVDYV